MGEISYIAGRNCELLKSDDQKCMIDDIMKSLYMYHRM